MCFKGKALNTSLPTPAIDSILLCRHGGFGGVISGFSIKGRQKNSFLSLLLTAHLAAYTCRYSKHVGAKLRLERKITFSMFASKFFLIWRLTLLSVLIIHLYRIFSVNAVMLKLSHPQTSIFPSRRVSHFFAQNQHYYHGFEILWPQISWKTLIFRFIF